MGLEEGILFQENVNYVPDGILKQRGLCVGMAWDNFDINIETCNGLGTIHHTYGTVYLNICSVVVGVKFIPAHRNSGCRFSKVFYNAKNDTIELYYKKPKIVKHELTSQEFLLPTPFFKCTMQESFYGQLEYHFSLIVYQYGMGGIH